MPNKPWKETERRIARYIEARTGHGRRNPLSGGNSGHTRSDIIHPHLFPEVKHGTACPRTWKAVEKLYKSVEILAAKEKKIPLLILHEKSKMGGVGEYDTYLRIALEDGTSPLICVPLQTAIELTSAADPASIPGGAE